MIILQAKFPWVRKASEYEVFASAFEEAADEKRRLTILTSFEISKEIRNAINTQDKAQQILLEHLLDLRISHINNKSTLRGVIITCLFMVLSAIIGSIVTQLLQC